MQGIFFLNFVVDVVFSFFFVRLCIFARADIVYISAYSIHCCFHLPHRKAVSSSEEESDSKA